MKSKKSDIPIVQTFEINGTLFGGYKAWYKCPHCKAGLHSDERELKGRERCPKCDRPFYVSEDAIAEIDSHRKRARAEVHRKQQKKNQFKQNFRATGIPIALAIIFLGFAFALYPLFGQLTRWVSFLLYLGAVFIFLVVVEIGNGGKSIKWAFRDLRMKLKISDVVLLFGGVLLLLCLLFPPWSYTYQRAGISQVKKSAGYGFLLSPPEPEHSQRRYALSLYHGMTFDWSRLILQVAVIVISTAVAWFLFERIARRGREGRTD